MALLGLILLHLGLGMLANCVLAWTMQTLWSWFCVASLGTGPSIGAWYGIATIIGLAIMFNTLNLKREDMKKSDAWGKPVSIVISCLVTLAFAWALGSLLSWKV